MRKVLIIGGNGSGKTTMARQLAEITGLPLCHLDTLYWTDDWQPRERSDFITLLQAELEKEEWILDGNMRRTLPQRLPYCDTVIYLDFSGIRCFFGTLKRLLQNHGQSRPDMGGPARYIVPWFLTMIVSSLMAGTYAPPAVHIPITMAICGMPIADIRAWL